MQKKALISVYNKTGIVEFASELYSFGYEIISTGGTANILRKSGIKVTDVSQITGFPEMMDGRVKTLHPKIHAGILAKRKSHVHLKQAKKEGIGLIDMVVVNLYPFEKVISHEDSTLLDAIENIDIGGPTLVRAAAKNYQDVVIITDIEDYPKILDEIKNGDISLKTKEMLAVKAFRTIADYDIAIDKYLSMKLAQEDILRLKFIDGRELRYGENWHQTSKFYKEPDIDDETCVGNAKQLHGKALSYNNYIDSDSAINVMLEFKNENTVVVVKHNNPCGMATGSSIKEALIKAWEGDSISAFGSIICMSKKPDMEAVKFLKDKFIEIIIAPEYDSDVLSFLKNKSKNLRIIELPMNGRKSKNLYRYVIGGMLVQSEDSGLYEKWDNVTKHIFPQEKKGLAEFAIAACKHTKSNAVTIAREYKKGYYQLLAIGAGQPNRVDSIRKLALTKAIENLKTLYQTEKPDMSEKEFISNIMRECVLASDAFFPFDDSIIHSAENNIRYIVSPGGSIRDNEVISTANKLGVSLIFTRMRHFLH